MTFTSKESILALEGAKLREQESIDMYQQFHDSAINQGTKAILAELVKEERNHYAILSKLLEQAKSGVSTPSVEIGETTSAQEFLEKTFKHVTLKDFHPEHASIDFMLQKAVVNEKESFALYSGLADLTKELETASVYQYLASQENKHYDMVLNLLNFMGNPGRWLYEEENLIFQNG